MAKKPIEVETLIVVNVGRIAARVLHDLQATETAKVMLREFQTPVTLN